MSDVRDEGGHQKPKKFEIKFRHRPLSHVWLPMYNSIWCKYTLKISGANVVMKLLEKAAYSFFMDSGMWVGLPYLM
jgi:hypothetical protein